MIAALITVNLVAAGLTQLRHRITLTAQKVWK